MLKLWSTKFSDNNYVLDIDRGYPLVAKKSWYNKYAIRAIEEIDGNRYIGDGVSESSVFGIIAPNMLSGGTKTLIFAMNNPDVICPLCNLGDNCANVLYLASKEYDMTFSGLYVYFDFHPQQEILCLETGEVVTGNDGYLEFLRKLDETT